MPRPLQKKANENRNDKELNKNIEPLFGELAGALMAPLETISLSPWLAMEGTFPFPSPAWIPSLEAQNFY